MSNLTKLSVEELISAQQDIMLKRGEAEKKFKEQAALVQFELDKRAFKARVGHAPSEAELAAIQEMIDEVKKANSESEEEV